MAPYIQDGPGYWLFEQGPILRKTVRRYLEGAELSQEDIAVLRAYVIQWIGHPIWNLNPFGGSDHIGYLRETATRIQSTIELDIWTVRACDAGLDPW